jgi:hypothetical protein
MPVRLRRAARIRYTLRNRQRAGSVTFAFGNSRNHHGARNLQRVAAQLTMPTETVIHLRQPAREDCFSTSTRPSIVTRLRWKLTSCIDSPQIEVRVRRSARELVPSEGNQRFQCFSGGAAVDRFCGAAHALHEIHCLSGGDQCCRGIRQNNVSSRSALGGMVRGA